jgi:GNAT superfamily N-acetyltransferase
MNRAIGLLSGGSGAESYQAGTVPGCDTAPVLIRDATAADWPAIWPFLHAIVSAGDTFAYDPAMGHDEARAMWLVGPPGRTVVAVDGDAVAGTANMYPNHGGPGSHIASGNFMVHADHRGRGIGRALGEEMIAWARREGYRGIKFNAVAVSNAPAVAMYEALGFEILATIPEGFRHPTRGYVGLHTVYLRL